MTKTWLEKIFLIRLSDLPDWKDVLPVTLSVESHVGNRRQRNEDSYFEDPHLGLWMVADGMGGEAAGDVASKMAIQTIARRIEAGESLPEAIRIAHEAILLEAERINKSGMGTTLVAAYFCGNAFVIAWVGDCRAYKVTRGWLTRLTRDHSRIQELLEAGVITEKQAFNHPQKNIITRALGGYGTKTPEVDMVFGLLHEDEALLFCSDGLAGEITDDVISSVLSEDLNFKTAAVRLVQCVLNIGGRDNITVMLIGYS